MNKLIAYILAIQTYNKNIHYNVYGSDMYAKHLLVDKFEFDYIDDIKEICLLGCGQIPLDGKEYLQMAIDLLPVFTDNTTTNFNNLQDLVGKALEHIETLQNLSKGEENLVGQIAQDFLQYYGLLNLQNS